MLAILTLLMLAALPAAVTAQSEETGMRSSTGFRPDAPQYGVRGDYPVGAHDLVVEGERTLDATVWYPALNDDQLEEVISYPYVIKMDAPPGATAAVSGQALRDAPYDLAAGPYPLVILSPGFILGRTTYAWMGEHLASYGFVVVAPDHQEHLDAEISEFWRSGIKRPQDIQSLLSYADAQSQTGGAFDGLIDMEHVAVIGHSYGGYTSLAMAGARYDLDSFAALCEDARAVNDPEVWLCDLILPHAADMAELAGLDSVPEGLWPSWGDPRVDAIVSMAGDAFFFNQPGLAEITVPVMTMGGTADTGTPYDWGVQPTYDYVSSPTKALVGFENAEHMIFGSKCETIPFFQEIGFYQFCSDAVWDMDRAHDLINHFTTAFLLAELKQDTDAAAALAPDAVSFTGILYEAQGF